MAVMQIKPNIYSVGAIDWNRRLFDELIPIPEGTSYNSYVIKGAEKTALIDAVDPSKESELIANLQKLGIKKIDYLVSNHAEQDHSGAIPSILKLYPDAKVVTNQKCKSMLMDLLLIPDEKFIVIADGQALSLGGKTLQFMLAPWVHWPETMFTCLPEDKILFTCDFFGSHKATSELFTSIDYNIYDSAKRYYAEIMMPFRTQIQKHIEKVRELNPEIIAPSHGPLYKKPEFIINAYADWVSDNVKNTVLVPYVSMHGSTAKMVEYLVGALMERGIAVKPFDLPKTDIGELAISLVDAATVVFAAPTVLFGAHPGVVYAAYLANAIHPKVKFASIIGSYGWAGKTVEQIKGLLPNIKAEFLEPVVIKGFPKEENFKALDRLADDILRKHGEIGIVK
ncbi:MAG: FprA family A-type flavoprotein [Planctomycetes bacterium]|nr:FprA family A-type flavoprotein [Planctomycetota bacterium]